MRYEIALQMTTNVGMVIYAHTMKKEIKKSYPNFLINLNLEHALRVSDSLPENGLCTDGEGRTK